MSTYWRADGLWGCQRHLVSKFPATLKRCYYSDCKNVCRGRPDLSLRVVIESLCNLSDCRNKKRKGSKYCSDECRKHYARRRYVDKIRGNNGIQHGKGK